MIIIDATNEDLVNFYKQKRENLIYEKKNLDSFSVDDFTLARTSDYLGKKSYDLTYM